jgi:DUF971 family protein
MPPTPEPTEIVVHGASRALEVAFDDGSRFRLPFEFLRVHSPSAEVQGHGPGQAVLQHGKRDVTIEHIEPAGRYGIKPRFSDGHDTGIYTWALLHRMGLEQASMWAQYEARLEAAGLHRGGASAPLTLPECES